MKVTDIHTGLTQARLKVLFAYNPETGVFVRLTSQANGLHAGDVAGSISTSGYHTLKVDNRPYLASRLAWLYMTGEWPIADVDHVNMDKTDTRWSNLRPASRMQNSANRSVSRRSTTGFKGVFRRNRPVNPFAAAIRVAGHLHHIGVFPTAEAAHAAYLERAREVHGEFARG